MRILIDTHILIWQIEGDTQLSTSRRRLIADPSNSVLISIASLWEIAIKISLGKLKISRFISDIFREINLSTSSIFAIEPEHLIRVA